VKEAKVHTSWINPNEQYEHAVEQFVRAILNPAASSAFLEDFAILQKRIAYFGVFNSLSQTLLKLASPGVPDIYQGTEMLEWSLVDPDNRRPVDYAARRAALAAVTATAALHDAAPASLASPYDGRAKLSIVARALGLRREHSQVFADGDYRRLDAGGVRAAHVVAFARTTAEEGVVAIAGRLFASLVAVGAWPIGDAWGDTVVDLGPLPSGSRVTNVLTGETFVLDTPVLPLARALAVFPGALLHYSSRAGGRGRDEPRANRA
jgi:(1->4)-alpha-D-glucan 1-alpha-D-glucosylmutase